MADPCVSGTSAGDGVLLFSISWLCRFIPVHSGCCSFTHTASLRASAALTEMQGVLGSVHESYVSMGSQVGGWCLLQPERPCERKNKFFYKPSVDARGLGEQFSEFSQTTYK